MATTPTKLRATEFLENHTAPMNSMMKTSTPYTEDGRDRHFESYIDVEFGVQNRLANARAAERWVARP